MTLIALTGGIASGKSTVAARFGEHGAVVIDADQVARDVVATGTPGLAAVVDRFGPQILTSSGQLDRPRLGRLIFGDPDARASLNGIVHPLVRAETRRRIAAARPDQVVVYDVPLLVEAPSDLPFDAVVVVSAPEEIRVERLKTHRGMTDADAWARIRAQATEAERLALADHVIDSSGAIEHTISGADRVWESLLSIAAPESRADGTRA